MSSPKSRQRSGLILLVVLSMLAFLGVLVVTYISFSSKSRRTSFALASRETRAPDVDQYFDDALMKLVRGTADPTDPFFGESLLDDLYGRKGAILTTATPPARMTTEPKGVGAAFPERRPVHLGGAFVRFPVDLDAVDWDNNPSTTERPAWTLVDDAFAGRIMTFKGGPLANQSFRILKSTGARPTANYLEADAFFIELDPTTNVTLGNGDQRQIDELLFQQTTPATLIEHAVSALFYAPGTDGIYGSSNTYSEAGAPVGAMDDIPYNIFINSTPQNAPGLGLNNGQLDQTLTLMGEDIPRAFFPNVFDGIATINKAVLGGDFDEAYDAPDYLNFFLSGRVRVSDGSGNFQDRIIPSFHRPSLINYLINAKDWSSSPQLFEAREAVQAIRMATFRPLPLAAPGQTFFTGGSQDFGLSTPLQIPGGSGNANIATIARIDLLVNALTQGSALPGDPRFGNPWDVDNDGDGVPDSIWVDLGLPLITSPEGKLLRPLVAPLIEDTGARLNVNAHGTYAQAEATYRNNPAAAWAGTAMQAQQPAFRGIGWGPGDIAFPANGTTGAVSAQGQAVVGAELVELMRRRNVWGNRNNTVLPAPGVDGADALDQLRFGTRPGVHSLASGIGHSVDPMGRGAVGVNRAGQLLAPVSGTQFRASAANQRQIDENLNDPYESDPTGQLNGDDYYEIDELEAVLRGNSWDIEMLPSRLRDLLRNSLIDKPQLAKMLTTLSTSFDFPNAIPLTGDRTGYSNPVRLIQVLLTRFNLDTQDRDIAGGETELDYHQRIFDENQKLFALLGPELLQGRKLDVNRPLGNGIDDDRPGVDEDSDSTLDEDDVDEFLQGFNGVVDEPSEFGNGRDDDGDGLIDEIDEYLAGFQNALDGMDNDGDGEVDEWDEITVPATSRPQNRQAFPHAGLMGSSVAQRFHRRVPNYVFGLTDQDLSGSGRELLARNLYVLMMAVIAENGAAKYDFPMIDSSTVVDPQEYLARRVAQWAVNAVDYRDPDSVMTRFAYDPQPLNGWDLAIDTNADNTPDLGVGRFDQSLPGADPLPALPSPVVWGCESPELLFSEGHATHDVRVRDTNKETGSGSEKDPSGDDDTDQMRIPQGSLFLELYCNRAALNGDSSALQSVPRDLYDVFDTTTGEAALDLDRLAPPAPGSPVGVPVWRIAISQPHYAGSAAEASNPNLVRASHPDTASFDPERLLEIDDAAPPSVTELPYERFLIFGNVADFATLDQVGIAMSTPSNTITGDQLFFAPNASNTHNDANNHLANRRLLPGQFLTLVPRADTRFGSVVFPSGGPPVEPSPMRIALNTAQRGMVQFNSAGVRVTPSWINNSDPIFQPLALVMKTFPPEFPTAGTPWEDVFSLVPANNMVGLNISEPLPRGGSYYTAPTLEYDGGTNYTLTDAYIDYDSANDTALDQPQDIARVGSPIEQLSTDLGTVPEPFIGLQPEYCSAFLQRLADPLRPFHPVFNPYITVDWLTLDLTVFSGEENGADSTAFPAATGDFAQQMRARNGHDESGTPSAILFSYNTDEPDNPAAANLLPIAGTPPRANYFQLTTPTGGIESTFGFLNTGATRFGATIGSVAASALNTADRGQPQIPFALHPWLDRPFASHHELMMVPACSPSRLNEEFTPFSTIPTDYPTAGAVVDDSEIDLFEGRHRHLLNFFQSSEAEDETAQLPRIFDYVTTLPRFRGEVEMVNPTRLTPRAGATASASASRVLGNRMRAPFNFLNDGRRQAEINLNTLIDYPVWTGLMHGHLTDTELGSPEDDSSQPGFSFQAFQASRRGYPVGVIADPQKRLVASGSVTPRGSDGYNFAPDRFDPTLPTQYAGAYRNVGDSDLAVEMPTFIGANAPDLSRPGAKGTILREDFDLSTGAPDTTPLFVRPNLTATHRNAQRSPWIWNQTLMRMPNLTTNQSQVFIVRLTMGFFEVDSSTLALGREYKADIAENERFQMLYIIDRSKPVAFEPGQDNNARDVVIYQRRVQ